MYCIYIYQYLREKVFLVNPATALSVSYTLVFSYQLIVLINYSYNLCKPNNNNKKDIMQ
jgi:hypothetical protein